MIERSTLNDEPNLPQMDLSALMDGECSAAQADSLCRLWQADASVREDWHAYHLIGDVLRSDELVGRNNDTAFLAKFHTRLANEPVVMAPLQTTLTAPRQARRSAMRRWSAPLGVAAGMALVAGTIWMLRPSAADPDASSNLAGATSAGEAAKRSAAAVQFERYLSAHKPFQPAATVVPPAGYLRSAVYEADDR